MKDRLLTIALSVATTLAVMALAGHWGPPRAVADDPPAPASSVKELVVDRLVVREELVVSDTGRPWEEGFERQQIARGMVARPLGTGTAGVWVRGRLIKTEIDDPFDDRFHAINRDGSMFRAPGHLSWNVWLSDAWRQLAIIQGETLENSEVAPDPWDGGNHPGRLRFQSFRPRHDEPLTDAILGQGKMSLGGGGFGGEGVPYPSEVLELWGGTMKEHGVPIPQAPRVEKDDGSGKHTYALISVGPQGKQSESSPIVTAAGRATLSWDSVNGADAYIVMRDGKPIGPLRIEGREKHWTDAMK